MLDAAGISGLDLVSLDDVPSFDEAPETGATFEENAVAKARDGYAATGLPTLADDSGLAVAALNGMPGVLSARWAGAHGDDTGNYALLLAQLQDVPDERRGAAFVSACALVSGPRDADAVVMAAAPADFRPDHVSSAKIKKDDVEVVEYLKATNPELFKTLKKEARAKRKERVAH